MNPFTSNTISKSIDKLRNVDINEYIKSTKEISGDDWEKMAEGKALSLFKLSAKRVPAYKDFLKKNKINSEKIKTINDFKKLPLVDKKNYISKYSIEELCVDGDISQSEIISLSSGTSGTPYMWPRSTFQRFEGVFQHEVMMNQLFDIKNKKSLAVVNFSMGAYLAGTYTLSSLESLSSKGYPLTVLAPGLSHEDVFSIFKHTAKYYDQIIFFGYPPFVKDIFDLGESNGIDWKKYNIKFAFASEFFSEQFREYMLNNSLSSNPYLDSTNIYGAADATLFGYEVPMTTYVRKKAVSDPTILAELFEMDTMPTIVEYNPTIRYFEKVKSEIVLTAASGIPLIRYNLHDIGGIIRSSELTNYLKNKNLDWKKEIKKNSATHTLNNLPYVYIGGRKGGGISFYGILIDRKYISKGLESKKIQSKISGRFALESVINKNQNQKIVVHVELKNKVKISKKIQKDIQKSVQESLIENSSEYNFLKKTIKKKADVVIKLYNKGESELFKTGIKQKWIKNQE